MKKIEKKLGNPINSYSLTEMNKYFAEILKALREQWYCSNTEIRLSIVRDHESCMAWFTAEHPHYIPKIYLNTWGIMTPLDLVESLCHEFAHFLTMDMRVYADNMLSMLDEPNKEIAKRLYQQGYEAIAARLETTIYNNLMQELEHEHNI